MEKKSTGKKNKTIDEYSIEEWKRAGLNTLWKIYIWTALADIVLFLVYGGVDIPREVYLVQYVLIPLIAILFVLLCFQVFLDKFAYKMQEVTVSVISLILMNLYLGINLCSFSNLRYTMALVFVPIIIAPIYKRKKLIYLQVGISMLLFLFCELIYIPLHPFVPKDNVLKNLIVVVLIFYGMVQIEMEVIASTNMLDQQTSRDSLTHLLNHEAFYEALDDQMAHFAENREVFSIIISDIDNFKNVNDTYGHAFGDEVIKRVAEIMVGCRGTRDICARYGGEEFAVILPNKSLDDAIMQAEKIRKAFAQAEFQTEDGTIHRFSISLGVAEYNREYKTGSAFFEKADKALYDAKGSGKNRVCCSR